MGLLDLFLVASRPIIKVFLITAFGSFLALDRIGILGDVVRKNLNTVVFFVYNPSLVGVNLASTVTLESVVFLRSWIGGEVVQDLPYDVPIPGYKTKNTNSLRLWEAKASAEDFGLFQFNDGQYEADAHLHSSAQQICAVLYPGDATENRKLLRLKQQFFLCSASLQDIISRFKERKSEKEWQWSEFPEKVAVQLNDTHPTLVIPELMRLLMDVERFGWDDAWNVTTRTIAYTNHTVLPEALENWSQAVMWKLLPRHMETIQEIDRRFIKMISSTRPDLESKLSSICIMDNDPKKPVVRMANLCVVSAHTVNGVAQLHSDILASELNYTVHLWRLLTSPSSLISNMLRCKYFRNGDLFGARAKPGDSHAWRNICHIISIFKEGSGACGRWGHIQMDGNCKW